MNAIPLVFALLVAAAAAAVSPVPPAGDDQRAEHLHHDFDSDGFRQLEAARAQIDFAAIDAELLDAAVFHETNRRRRDHQLAELGYMPELRAAARLQSHAMQEQDRVTHRHPLEEKQTLEDRLAHFGLQPAFAAENVAMSFGVQYASGDPLFPRQENGQTVLSATPGGPPVPAHTYLSFAQALLDEWMASPSHRNNILHPNAQFLGTGAIHDLAEGLDRFFSTQVFFSPLHPRQATGE